jgi:hypothetical protein
MAVILILGYPQHSQCKKSIFVWCVQHIHNLHFAKERGEQNLGTLSPPRKMRAINTPTIEDAFKGATCL